MLPEKSFQRDRISVCIGTGLITLDVVMNGHPTHPLGTWAGGSCGNVLAILAFLGWTTRPIARMGDDTSAAKLMNDLAAWGVDTSLISQNHLDKTPVIVERLTSSKNGMVRHSFQWNCPSCDSKLPRYKAITASNLVENIIENISSADVFYFDRVRRSIIELASLSKERGALIIFEPSGIRDKTLYRECVKIADIVKYSSERIRDAVKLHEDIAIPLEIQTLGSKGLRYKCSNDENWSNMTPYEVHELKDPAGSGDWCTAGIIHTLGRDGKKGFTKASKETVETALKFGQALAALNCYYEGARGSMYCLTKQKFHELLSLVLAGKSPLVSVYDFDNQHKISSDPYTCPFCDVGV
jgi:sugar/nucleoside kinase (ribokinase family)